MSARRYEQKLHRYLHFGLSRSGKKEESQRGVARKLKFNRNGYASEYGEMPDRCR